MTPKVLPRLEKTARDTHRLVRRLKRAAERATAINTQH